MTLIGASLIELSLIDGLHAACLRLSLFDLKTILEYNITLQNEVHFSIAQYIKAYCTMQENSFSQNNRTICESVFSQLIKLLKYRFFLHFELLK